MINDVQFRAACSALQGVLANPAVFSTMEGTAPENSALLAADVAMFLARTVVPQGWEYKAEVAGSFEELAHRLTVLSMDRWEPPFPPQQLYGSGAWSILVRRPAQVAPSSSGSEGQ